MNSEKILGIDVQFKKFTDGRGDLIPIEIGEDFKNADVPFEVRRCYFIAVPTNEGPDCTRGNHAHHNLEQVMVCVNGSFTLTLDDGLGNIEHRRMSKDDHGVHLKGLLWRQLSMFSPNCVIAVFASQHYQEDDYIRDYEQFLKSVAIKNRLPYPMPQRDTRETHVNFYSRG